MPPALCASCPRSLAAASCLAIPPHRLLSVLCCDCCRVPVALVAGCIGQITIHLDWANLQNEPIKISIDSVFACIKLRGPADSDSGSDSGSSSGSGSESDEPEPEREVEPGAARKWPNFMQQKIDEIAANIEKIVENIQFKLTNVHIRLEDDVTGGGDLDKHVAMGVTITRLAITNAVEKKDGSWKDKFVTEPVQLATKRIVLGNDIVDNGQDSGLALYCNSGAGGWKDGGGETLPRSVTKKTAKFQKAMRKMISSETMSYIVRPIQMEVILRADKSEGVQYDKGLTKVRKGVRIARASKTGEAYDTCVMKQPFSDGTYRYEPLHEVRVDGGEVRFILDSQTIRYLVSLGVWAVALAPDAKATTDDDSDSDRSSSSGSEEEEEESSSSDDDHSDEESSSDEDERTGLARDCERPPDDWTKLKIELKLARISLKLTRESGKVRLRDGELAGLMCALDLRESGGVSATCMLRELTIYDMSTADADDDRALGIKILQTRPQEAEDLLDLCVESQYQTGDECRLTQLQPLDDDFDLRVRMRLQPVLYVLDLSSLKDLTMWAEDISRDDLDDIADVSATSRSKVATKARKSYEKAKEDIKTHLTLEAITAAKANTQKFDLDIELCAPIVFIPGTGGSVKDGVAVELGKMFVKTLWLAQRDTRRHRTAHAQDGLLEVKLHGLSVMHGNEYVVSPVDLELDVLLQMLLEKSKLSVLWNHIDVDGNGTLDVDELEQLFHFMGQAKDGEELEDIMGEIDEDDSGDVEQAEFLAWWRKEMNSDDDTSYAADEVEVLMDDMTIRPSNDVVSILRRAVHLASPTEPNVSLRTTDYPDGIGVKAGEITCNRHSTRWKHDLFATGVSLLQVRKKGGLKQALYKYEICFEVDDPGRYVFTDATGDTYSKDCKAAGSYKIAFGSDIPSLVLMEKRTTEGIAGSAVTAVKGVIGESGLKATVAYLSMTGLSIARMDEKKVRREDLLVDVLKTVSLMTVLSPFIDTFDDSTGGDTFGSLRQHDVDSITRFQLTKRQDRHEGQSQRQMWRQVVFGRGER